MIEIVCPSCEARYQVPDDSIGPEGRKVTCSNCSHKWRAYRETVGAESAAAAEVPPAAAPAAVAPEPVASEPVEAESAETAAAQSSAEGAPRGGGREEQMDAIRRMLDDLKRSSEDEPAPEPESEPRRSTRPEPSQRRRAEEDEFDDPNADPLKSRIAQLDKSAKPADKPSNYDAAKLRRMHEKRARRLQKAKERQRKSGAFITGFTLVAVVTAAMVGLYVMQPQIVATSPEVAPAMNEYVGTVDRYRLALDEATADWRVWVEEQVAPIFGGEGEGGGESQGQAQETQQQAGEASTTSQ